MEELFNCVGFDWDEGNIQKNWHKHKVTPSECEEVFFNQPLVVEERSLSIFFSPQKTVKKTSSESEVVSAQDKNT